MKYLTAMSALSRSCDGAISGDQMDAKIGLDPRELLSEWANDSDEWARYVVRQVFAGAAPLALEQEECAFALFRQEKSLDPRVLPTEAPLATLKRKEEAIEPVVITSLSHVAGVNALTSGGVIEPHEGLTILFGENGTGKTGYSRIFKSLAGSRTADLILGDIAADAPQEQSAVVSYTLGSEAKTYNWTGQSGVAPFTRMSIFDSPSVSFHVDDDLEYSYVPAGLALFNHVIAGIKGVQVKIAEAVVELRSDAKGLISRFPRGSTVYPLIETLGASTNLDELRAAAADPDANVEERIGNLRRTVAALEADTLSAQIKVQQRFERVLTQACGAARTVGEFNVIDYENEIKALTAAEAEYVLFRTTLFEAADLPAEPDATWSDFIGAGETYREHLITLDAHNTDHCLYCRQPLNETARSLVSKYSEYLEDKITDNIAASKMRLNSLIEPILNVQVADLAPFVNENSVEDDKPSFYEPLLRAMSSLAALTELTSTREPLSEAIQKVARADGHELAHGLEETMQRLEELRGQAATRIETLAGKKKDLVELEAAAELAKSWAQIEKQVADAKQADRLAILGKPMPGMLRTVTSLAKTASDHMINESFDALFVEERDALRAPVLKIEYVGRQGRAQRRKVMSGKHKPSKILSEGEQKVLAMADFLAEARLAGITAPVIFDDPVSSLDHRRVREVAKRIVSLSATTQVIVFTHDILFASTLLSLMERTKRCSYFQITDEEGKGRVTRATGPRWDNLAGLRAKINDTIQTAKTQEGESRAALVCTGYDWIRSWCEVFAETELLQGVSERYQPNIRMGNLSRIKVSALPDVIETVTRIFNDACRFIDGHSQPLASLGVSPTLTGLETHWAELKEARVAYLAADD